MPGNLQDLLNPELIAKIVSSQQQTDQRQQSAYDVPVVYTQPPVTFRGRLELNFTFPHDVAAGKSYQDLQQLAYAVVMGNSGPGLPQVEVGSLNLWQEQQIHAPEQPQQEAVSGEVANRIIAEYLRELGRIRVSGSGEGGGAGDSVVPEWPDDDDEPGGLPGPGDRDDGQDAWHPLSRTEHRRVGTADAGSHGYRGVGGSTPTGDGGSPDRVPETGPDRSRARTRPSGTRRRTATDEPSEPQQESSIE